MVRLGCEATHRTGTHPEQRNLYQQAISRDSGIKIGVAGGLPLPGVRYRGVARNFLGNGV